MSEFKEWFLNQYKYCEEYFEITTFEDACVGKGTFIPGIKCDK